MDVQHQQKSQSGQSRDPDVDHRERLLFPSCEVRDRPSALSKEVAVSGKRIPIQTEAGDQKPEDDDEIEDQEDSMGIVGIDQVGLIVESGQFENAEEAK